MVYERYGNSVVTTLNRWFYNFLRNQKISYNNRVYNGFSISCQGVITA